MKTENNHEKIKKYEQIHEKTKETEVAGHGEESLLWKPVTCYFGLRECSQNEECKTKGKARYGVCTCVEGFTRNETTGQCMGEST